MEHSPGIDDGEDATGEREGDALTERGDAGALLEKVIGIALDAGSGELAHGLGGNEAGDGVADGFDGGYAGVFHGLADAVEVVAGVADVAEIDGAIEGDQGSVGPAEAPAQNVELAVAEPEGNFEQVAGGEALVRDAEKQEAAIELEDGAEGAVGGPGGGAVGGDDGPGMAADSAEAVGEVAAAVVAGAAADLVGDGTHVGRGVDWVKDEVGGVGGFVVEGGADEGAGGAEDLEDGIDDGRCAADDVAETAEGAVDHEDLAGLDAEAAHGRGQAVVGEDHV